MFWTLEIPFKRGFTVSSQQNNIRIELSYASPQKQIPGAELTMKNSKQNIFT
jgi:hypothetical protein